MKFPSIPDVVRELRLINENMDCSESPEEGCDVRLQVYEEEDCWTVRYGDASYDTDHHGYWGASSVPGVVKGVVKRFNSTDVARDLIEQAKDQYHESKV